MDTFMQYVEFLQGQKYDVIYLTPPHTLLLLLFFNQVCFSTVSFLVKHWSSQTRQRHIQTMAVILCIYCITKRCKGSFPAYYEEPYRNFVDKWSNPAQQLFWSCKPTDRKLLPPQMLVGMHWFIIPISSACHRHSSSFNFRFHTSMQHFNNYDEVLLLACARC